MLIWGWRTRVYVLAMTTFLCGQCGNPASHAVRKAVTKFTLFFIPLFPIGVKYTAQCTFCGMENRISKEDAVRLQAQEEQGQSGPQSQGFPQQGFQQHPSQPHPSQPHPSQPQGFPQPQHPSQSFPQQQYPPQSQYPHQGN